MSDWKNMQKALVSGSGATSAAIPGFHLAGLIADVTFLMNRMATCSYGVGAIVGNQVGLGNFLEEEDFSLILGMWAGEEDIKSSIKAK